ncbi:hypothetical protein LTR17_015725 [Elasticomyces elasticus]|nr:hypothetical protein LTR17_015725 [Elasticomyces elasticus]
MAEQLARQYFHTHIEDEHTIFDLRLELATQQMKPTSIAEDVSLEAVSAENEHLKSLLAEKEACINNLKTQLDMMSESREIEMFAAEMAALQLELTDERANQAMEDADSRLMLEDVEDNSLADWHVSGFTPSVRHIVSWASSTPDPAWKGRYDGKSDGTEDGETSEKSPDGKEGAETHEQVNEEGGAQQVNDANAATAARSSQHQLESGGSLAREGRPSFPSNFPDPTLVKHIMDECATELEQLAESLADPAKDNSSVIVEVLGTKYIILPNTASVIGDYLSSATAISDQLDNLIDEVVGEGLKGEIRIFKAVQKMRQYVFDREEALIEHMSVYEDYIQDLFDGQDDPFMQSVIERFLQKVETALRA